MNYIALKSEWLTKSELYRKEYAISSGKEISSPYVIIAVLTLRTVVSHLRHLCRIYLTN